MSEDTTVTAAMLAIGDELLSGRTKDKNIGHLADMLTLAGIDLREVRIVADDEADIAAALNALRDRYDYVFTSGGIGPTHDDITADAIGKAFGLPVIHDEKAMRLLGDMYARRGIEFNEARQRMARMPEGSRHIDNPVSTAPGFVIGNVYVMAGVPNIFQAMLDGVLPQLRSGTRMQSRSVPCPFGEGDIGEPLAAIQRANPDTIIGSYPKFNGQSYSTDIVIRAREVDVLDRVETAVREMVARVAAGKK
ncbi:competence/damage-inducible protein A [Rhizobium sp. KVB221]|uniref:Competence/damage-inducible protein A n=1 Tax=Rhizobium setariae TaxID=2801340 RepID=A0A936YSF5_9HYPH|nr:competence/damage-inducible protein A [Rhizobium setariae]MBL0373886.1 competence/damage-inducible protein A [Rhizobium setariae]